MCPPGAQRAGDRLRDGLRRTLGDPARLPAAALVALSLLLLGAACSPALAVVGLLLGGCGGYLGSGLLRGLAGWKPLTGLGGARRPIPPRRQRAPAPSKWSPADLLLLMGSYMGKQEPPAGPLGRGSREIREQLSRPNPAVLTPARRLSFRETPCVSNRNLMNPRRRYPTHQPHYSMPGSFPMVCLDGYQRKILLSPKNSMMRSPVTVKIARPDSNIAHSPVLDHLLALSPASTSVHSAPDPCAKETVLSAIRDSRKRTAKDEECSVLEGQETKRRRPHTSGSGQSTFKPLVANGTPSSLVSKPDNLKRALNLQVPDDTIGKRCRTSSVSSVNSPMMNGLPMSSHNAITSSYSSGPDLLQKRKRSVQNTSTVSSTSSSRCQTPEWQVKKAREEELHESNTSTPVKSDSREQSSGKLNETLVLKKSAGGSPSSDTGSSGGKRRRKVLLVCSGRGEPYPLPPPPLVGYSITSKDWDSEKKAALQRLNKALEETPDSLPSSSTPVATSALQASHTFTLAPAAPKPLELQTSTASSNPLLQSLAKMQSQEVSQAPAAVVTLTQSTANTITTAPMVSFSLTANSSEVKPSMVSAPTPSLSAPALASVTPNSSALSQPLGLTQPKSESPKNGILFQMLSNTDKSPQPSFKPVFRAPQTANPPAAPLLSATTSAAPATTFKPIFGKLDSQGAPLTASLPFTFQQTATSTAPSQSFPSLSGTGTSTDSTAKPTFVLSTTSTPSSSTAPTFQFGAAPQSLPCTTSSLLANDQNTAPQNKPAAPFGQLPTLQTNAGFSLFGSKQTAPVATAQPQPVTAFGSTTSAFTTTFGSTTNPPSFSGNTGQAAFNSSTQVQTSKPTPLPSFGSSVGQLAFGTGTQSAFSNSSQPAFGAGTQQTFGGATNPAFSFGNTAPAATKSTTFGTVSSAQTSVNAPNTALFGVPTQAQFSFGGASNTAATGFGSGTPSNNTGRGFNFGAAQNAPCTTAAAFGSSSVAQNSIGTTNQSAPFGFGTPGTTENKLAFSGTSTPTFGQSVSSTTGSFGFGTPTPGFVTPGPAFTPAPSFSIGSGSKPSSVRQRLQARRQNTRKK
ncbi:nuclear envelope pore membrane protein POM 121 [Ascaphus truei]|uniref:nuclear envelope pore membrane protein POM 121 n=1 Tax=Ascaphus truei TaxID=8439 RepID=UPI003F59F6EA